MSKLRIGRAGKLAKASISIERADEGAFGAAPCRRCEGDKENATMNSHKPGRPAKPVSKRRQQLHISLYPDDIERLDRLTSNRSEFIRQCIAKAWAEKTDGEVTLRVTLPRRLLHGLLTTASVQGPPQPIDGTRDNFQALLEQLQRVSGRAEDVVEDDLDAERVLAERADEADGPLVDGRRGVDLTGEAAHDRNGIAHRHSSSQ
jgi:hypothetical protein